MEYIIEAENTSPRKQVKPLHLLDEWVIERFFLAINQRKIANRKYINPDIKASLYSILETDNANKLG